MLIFARRVGEDFKISDTIEVSVLSINGNQVRLGIAARKNVPVRREGIYERVGADAGACCSSVLTPACSDSRSSPTAAA